MLKKPLVLLMLVLLVSGIVGACSGGSDAESAAGGSAAEAPRNLEEGLNDGGGGGSSGAAVGQSYDSAASTTSLGDVGERARADADLGGSALPSVGPSVIKTADLSVEVDEGGFNEAVRKAIAVAETHGGYVVTTNVEDRKLGFGSVTLRVPAEAFGGALDDLHDLGTLKSESVSGRDVSQEFVDLQARLRNWQTQEAVLLRLMDRSVSIADTLRVQSHLQRTQFEIEQLKGRLNYLRDRTNLSTISVWIAEIGAAPTKPGMLKRAWERAVEISMSVVSAVIVGAGFVVPVAILATVVALVIARLRPRFLTGWERP